MTRTLLLVGLLALMSGCTALPTPTTVRGQAPEAKTEGANDKDAKDNDKDEKKDPPKTLFEWAIPAAHEKKEDDKGDGKEEPIVTDRPDFTEASSTVGLGRVQLEAGYTWIRDREAGNSRIGHTYPEALLRVGLFADWFEFRLGETYANSRASTFGRPDEHLSGLGDLYVGTKLGLTEQKGHLPEMALILQATLPTGSRSVSNNEVLPGFNLLFGWEVVPDFLSVGASLQANRAIDDTGHTFLNLSQSFTVGYTLTEKLGAFTEWFAFYPMSAVAPSTTAQHYVDGGFTYKVTPNFQLDIRAGYGLSRSADDLFAGAGFAVRY